MTLPKAFSCSVAVTRGVCGMCPSAGIAVICNAVKTGRITGSLGIKSFPSVPHGTVRLGFFIFVFSCVFIITTEFNFAVGHIFAVLGYAVAPITRIAAPYGIHGIFIGAVPVLVTLNFIVANPGIIAGRTSAAGGRAG